MSTSTTNRASRGARALLLLLVAAAIWLPNLHRLHSVDLAVARDPSGPWISGLVARQTAELTAGAGADARAQMRAVNPEWDFMSRTYTVLALANLAHRPDAGPARAKLLASIDAIVDDTLRFEKQAGAFGFMMGYARRGPFVDREAYSVFIDGEVLAMIAARSTIEPREDLSRIARARAERIERAMQRSPSKSVESYPNECWTFCNTTALAGLAMMDRALGSDHRATIRAWLDHARAHLVEPRTGLLVSSYTYDGATLDGPEGSSIWMVAANLLAIDEDFARDQYARAKRELAGEALGYAWAREWPAAVPGRPDVDSGPIVPIVEASAGSSGLAILGAAAFRDDAYLGGLLTSLGLAAFPEHDDHGVRFRASNQVGDAVLLYSLSFGPLWEHVRGQGSSDARLGAKEAR